jgi:hypothetical protein
MRNFETAMLTKIRLALHYLAHLLMLNRGRIERGVENGVPMMGFRCSKCGRLDDWKPT